MWAALIPQAGDQSRAYFVYPKTMGYRLQGESMLSLFVRESAKAYPPIADYCADGKSIGPLASFDVSDTWVEHPYRDGLAMLRQLLTQPTARGFLSLYAVRACFATN